MLSMLAANGGAWLFEPGAATALSDSLLRIVADDAEMEMRGRNAVDSVRGRYSWTATAQRLEDIIRSEMGADR